MNTHLTVKRVSLKSPLGVAAWAVLALLAAPAYAAHGLPAGDTASPVPTPFPANFASGTLLASKSLIGGGAAFSGTFASAVYSNFASAADATNAGFVEGAPVLDFVYQFTNSPNSVTAVGRLSMFDFASGIDPNQFSVLAWDQAADVDGAATLFVTGNQEADNAQRGAAGKAISFNYGDTLVENKINAGEAGYAILLRVNAQNYTNGAFSAINGTSATVDSFAPTAAIPEPETYALMLGGLGLVGFIARRRRNA